MKLTFALEVDEEGLQDYYRRHPELAVEDNMDASKTLIREAIAEWTIECLIVSDDIYELVEVSDG